MLSKSPLRATKGRLTQVGIYFSFRNVHWYHDQGKQAGGTKDEYELFNRQREFGQGEIDDKDRFPHLYWNLWKGRTHLQRVVQQWGYSKDHKPEYLRREAEKMAYFMKLDDLDFLEQTRAEYSFIDDDANNAVGYITDDEDDEILEHCDYGSAYNECSAQYKALILSDHCLGRPVYEWQVPYGLDEAYGYKSIQTAVDVICNEKTVENYAGMEWKEVNSENKGLLLQNENTQQQICLIDSGNASELISKWAPSTVVIQCGAERLLSQMKSAFAPTNRTDMYGCMVSLGWSTALYLSPLWPLNPLLGAVTTASLLALNGTFVWRTFMHPSDRGLKKVFGAVRKAKANLVLGDWLSEDYDERLSQVIYFDDLSANMTDNALLQLSDGKGNGNASVMDLRNESSNTFKEFMSNVSKLGSAEVLHRKSLTDLNIDNVSGDQWCQSFRDAVNNRRIDLLSQVLNNCEGDKILMSVDDVDNIKSTVVMQLLQRRLSGQIGIGKPVLKYDNYYERVEVDI